MPYISLSDFKFGMDRRRPRDAGVPGTLWTLRNGHITRGGDVEGMKKFVPLYNLPAGTHGLGQVAGQIWVFGSADLAAAMPAGVQYQRLDPGYGPMIRVLSNNTFDGKHYVIAEFTNGYIAHFYNGAHISAWGTKAAVNSTVTSLADYLSRKVNAAPAVEAQSSGPTIIVTASTPGTAFTISAATTNAGGVNDQTAAVTTLQANVSEAREVRATATVTITGGSADPGLNMISQVTVSGAALLAAPVNFISSTSATAAALAVAINNRGSITGYTASAAGAVITIRAAVGTGAAPNGYVVVPVAGGNVAASATSMAGGVAYVAPVAQISRVALGGTYEAQDAVTITINGTAYIGTGLASGAGTFAYVYKRREYFTAGSLFYYSKLNDPADITDASTSSGAGFINLTSDSEGSDRLTSIALYQNMVAIFSRNEIRIYQINTDSAQNAFQQVLENTGTFAPRSVTAYGNIDVFYLDHTGIRSIQARDTTNAAFIDDAGAAIDTFVQDWTDGLSEDIVERAVSVIEPIDGRFWLAIGNRIFVLSYFPKAKITAWSYYEPGFTPTDFVRANRRVYTRDANTVYLYGGRDGRTYPAAGETPVLMEVPFINAQSIATFKEWLAFDLGCSGTWDVDLLADPTDETKIVHVGKIFKTTYQLPGIAVVGEAPMFGFNLACESAGRRVVSNMAFHYKPTRAG